MYLTVQQRLDYPWVKPRVYLAPKRGSRDIEAAPDLPLRQTMNELGKVMS